MILPTNFQFNQGSLQDFVDCPLRFQLKYIQKLAWPALKTDSALEFEQYIQLGAAFHKIIQQYYLNVSEDRLNYYAKQDVNLLKWWENFLNSSKLNGILHFQSGTEIYPEISLTTPINSFRVTGKFDLLTVSDNKFTIFDWKTSKKPSNRTWLESRLQSQVYPYLLYNAAPEFNLGNSINPSQIEMIYWYPNSPHKPQRINYSEQKLNETHKKIIEIIEEIKAMDDSQAAKTHVVKHCKYCVYRSFCNRGIVGGLLDDMEDIDKENIVEIDFEEIGEIEF